MADSSYVIDIAASMPDSGTTAQLDELSQSLIDAGASAETLEAAAADVAAQLSAAGDATSLANEALKEGNARYSELERAAIKAAKAVEKAGAKGVIDPELSRASHDAALALDEQAASLRGLEQEASRAAKAQAKLTATQGNLKKLTSSANKAFSGQAAAAAKSVREAEAMVPLVKGYRDFGDAVSTGEGKMILAAGAAAGLAVAVAAVTVALVAGTLAVAAYAVGLANTKREAGLTEEAVAALHPELGALSGTFADVTAETGIGAAELRGFKKQLDSAKVAAGDVPAALRAMALAETALGKGGSAEFLETLKDSKRAAGDLADEFNGKLGGVVAKRMMGLDAQSKKLGANLSNLFGGLNIDPVLEGFRVLVDLFDEGTAAGEAMKFLFEEIFQPIIDQATNAAYVVEAFILGFLIGMTKLYIKLKPVINAVKDFFGFEDTGLSDVLDIAKNAGELIAPVFVGLVAIFGALMLAVGLAIAPFVAISAAVYAMIGALVSAGATILGSFMGAWQGVKDFFANLSLADVGLAIVRGLAAGITGGAGEVISAMINVAKGAIKAAKSALGIASPSKELADIGGFTAEGFVQGVDDGAGDAQDAMAAMVEPPEAGAAGYTALAGGAAQAGAAGSTGGAAPKASKAGGAVNIYGDLYFGGAKASQAEKEDLAEALTKLLEGDAAAIAGEEDAA